MPETESRSKEKKPEGFDKLVEDIKASHERPGDSQLQEVVLKKCIKYLHDNSLYHLFCDPFMYPISVHSLLLFSFLNNEILHWLKPKIVDSLQSCRRCVEEFSNSKSALRYNFAILRRIPMKQVVHFLNVLNNWEASRILETFIPFASEIKSGHSPSLSPRVEYAVLECLVCPDVVRINSDVKDLFFSIIFYLQGSGSWPYDIKLYPLLLYGVFEEKGQKRDWCADFLFKLRQKNITYNSSCISAPVVDEFSIHLYRIQDAKFFNNESCITFWKGFLQIVDLCEEDAIAGKLNQPNDIEAMSKFTNLRLYPLIRVLFNQILAFLSLPFPYIIKALGKLLGKLKEDFWSLASPYSFVNILDTALNNPQLKIDLSTLSDSSEERDSVTFDDYISWMKLMPLYLGNTQSQTSSIKLGTFLLHQKNNMSKARVDRLHIMALKMLSECLNTFSSAVEIGDANLSIEILKRRDVRATIENFASVIVLKVFDIEKTEDIKHSAEELIIRSFLFDTIHLAQNTQLLLQGKVPTSFDTFPVLWQMIKKNDINRSGHFGIKLIESMTFVCNILQIAEKKTDDPSNKKFIEAKRQHNEGAILILKHWSNILENLSLSDSSVLRTSLGNSVNVLVGLWSSIFSPSVSQEALDVVYQIFDIDVGGRFETFHSLISASFKNSLVAIDTNLRILSRMEAYEPCPKALRILMDVVQALTDPLEGILVKLDSLEHPECLEHFWNSCWSLLVMVYKKTLIWASFYHLEQLIEFTRDTLDLSHHLLDSFRLMADRALITGANKANSLFQTFMSAFSHAIVWLRLGDTSLLNSCVDLVFKGFDLASDLNFSVGKDFIINFAKYGAKAKKYNNKLTEVQRSAILAKAKEFDEDTVNEVIAEAQEYRNKGKTTLKESSVMHENKGQSPASFTYQTHVKQPKQQTLSRFGVMTSQPPLAPPPVQKSFKSSHLEAIRQELKSNRGVASKEVAKYEPAAARPAGFNPKRPVTVGRSLNLSKKKLAESDYSDEGEEEEDVDISDLFVERRKDRPKVVEVDISGRPVLNSYKPKKPTQKSEEELMRLRLNVNLKPLYSTILKWNYNSDSAYPSADKEMYKEVKEDYYDWKDYVKVMEPLLMLECWQGIQSAKQTGLDVPFELLIGSRTSCDGFFDVYASLKKSTAQERKLSDSDLIVLGVFESNQNEKSNLELIMRHLKDKNSMTCLAKVREIKSANSEYCDVVLRVYPQGAMMGVLTPQAVVYGIRVMQMVTVEREYSSLKGLQYYDLFEEFVKSKPTEPIKLSNDEASKMQKLFDVNKSQAQAIMGTYRNEGFSLIQGPPGTGKTKTILGIIGYAISQLRDGVIDVPQLALKTLNSPTPPNKTRILVCAPSNAAVDELVIRLKSGILDSSGKRIYPLVVRLGRSDAINSAVRDLTLEELVDKQLQLPAQNGSIDPTIRQEHTKCIEERNMIREKLTKPNLTEAEATTLENRLREINRARHELAKKLDEQREKVSIVNRTREIERRQLQAKILGNADILCSTLSGSAHDFLASMSVKFERVIIDEACQCVELSAVIPLRYGCKSCIMVGDPNQLPPTVLSQAAASFHYDQSLFVRMQKKFPESVYLLDVQYRMHPDISYFPSQEFYNGRLHDGPDMAAKCARPWHSQFPLTPYHFFNIVGKQQKNKLTRSLFNLSEAKVALEIVNKLSMILPEDQFRGRIGIISPYKEQIKTLKDVFRKEYGHSIFSEIDFNTVDGFQGQEKEIIIMSCVRANEHGDVGFLSDIRRMNVALTRARTSLWILGNSDSLSRNKVWNLLLKNASSRQVISNAYPGFLNHVKNVPISLDTESDSIYKRKLEFEREEEGKSFDQSKKIKTTTLSDASYPEISCSKLDVTVKDEKGEGKGFQEYASNLKSPQSIYSDQSMGASTSSPKIVAQHAELKVDSKKEAAEVPVPVKSGVIPKPKFMNKKTSSLFINRRKAPSRK